MRRGLVLAVGILIGQWLAFGSRPSPAPLYTAGLAAWQRGDAAGALQWWSQAASLEPADPVLHYRRATALARLGQAHAAADAYRLTLLLDPPADVDRLAREGLARLDADRARPGPRETTVPVEPARGVWLAAVVLNGHHPARFLVDTGSGVTMVSPALAGRLGLVPALPHQVIELHTVGGPTVGAVARLASLRLGGLEQHDVPVVIHDPGPRLDGILGNSFLGRYRLTLDADRRLLHLQP